MILIFLMWNDVFYLKLILKARSLILELSLFLLDYIKEHILKGYDKNKYEIEARRSESNYCKYNYIECQRKGLAKSNLFRKNKRFGKLL